MDNTLRQVPKKNCTQCRVACVMLANIPFR
nr:MAG TPA: hypothetical protein [Caudoviricetes sp.]